MVVSLQKGSTLSLAKGDGSKLSRVVLGLGWDSAKRGLFSRFSGGEIDLDASAILFDDSGRNVDVVYFGQLVSKDGSVRHTGDNLTGAGDGDDEQIIVDLSGVHERVKDIVFTINSYSGQTFDQVENVHARVLDVSSGSEVEVVRYNLAESARKTANVIAKLSRTSAGWEFKAIGEFADGRTAQALVGVASQSL